MNAGFKTDIVLAALSVPENQFEVKTPDLLMKRTTFYFLSRSLALRYFKIGEDVV